GINQHVGSDVHDRVDPSAEVALTLDESINAGTCNVGLAVSNLIDVNDRQPKARTVDFPAPPTYDGRPNRMVMDVAGHDRDVDRLIPTGPRNGMPLAVPCVHQASAQIAITRQDLAVIAVVIDDVVRLLMADRTMPQGVAALGEPAVKRCQPLGKFVVENFGYFTNVVR